MNNEEQGFLRALAAQPDDDALRLVYADWLEERGDPESAVKAEFIRAECSRAAPARLRGLATGLDTRWLATVSKLKLENCPNEKPPISFEFRCPRKWETLKPTEDHLVRHCDLCHQEVFYCSNINVARSHVRQGHCVAVDLRLLRLRDDLETRPPLRAFRGIVLRPPPDPPRVALRPTDPPRVLLPEAVQSPPPVVESPVNYREEVRSPAAIEEVTRLNGVNEEVRRRRGRRSREDRRRRRERRRQNRWTEE